MTESDRPSVGDHVVVTRRSLAWLADTTIRSHRDAVLAKRRSATIVAVAATLSASGSAARVTSREADGTDWSITITPPHLGAPQIEEGLGTDW